MKNYKAKFVTSVTVIDPDSGGEVNVEIYKDSQSDGMFGIDSSFVEQVFDEDEPVLLPSLFNENNTIELEEIS